MDRPDSFLSQRLTTRQRSSSKLTKSGFRLAFLFFLIISPWTTADPNPNPNDPLQELSSSQTSGEKAALSPTVSTAEAATHVSTSETFAVTEDLLHEYLPLSTPFSISTATYLDDADLKRLTNEAYAGSPESSYFLGLSHLYGLGSLTPSAVSAAKYFRSASIQGNPAAQCALGLILYQGYGGVGRDSKAATLWFRKAAEQEHVHGYWLLGRAYYEGRVQVRRAER